MPPFIGQRLRASSFDGIEIMTIALGVVLAVAVAFLF
jgi:hypothetical protein